MNGVLPMLLRLGASCQPVDAFPVYLRILRRVRPDPRKKKVLLKISRNYRECEGIRSMFPFFQLYGLIKVINFMMALVAS